MTECRFRYLAFVVQAPSLHEKTKSRLDGQSETKELEGAQRLAKSLEGPFRPYSVSQQVQQTV